MLASPDRLIKDMFVIPVIVPELKFRDVEWQILGADLVERADHATLEDRPKAFDRVCVDRADDILAGSMADNVVRIILVQPPIADPFIRDQEAYLLGYRAAHKRLEDIAADSFDNTSDDLSLAFDGPDDGYLARADTAPTWAASMWPVPVPCLAADERFVNLNDTHEFTEIRVGETGPDPVAHIPSRLVRTESHVAVDLQRANPLLAGQHQVDNAEPITERLIRVFKDCTGNVRETISAPLAAVRAFPVPLAGFQVVDTRTAATRTRHLAVWPAMRNEVCGACVIIGKSRFTFADSHLTNCLWLLNAGHLGSPVVMGGI
jgi:hypothetical protein